MPHSVTRALTKRQKFLTLEGMDSVDEPVRASSPVQLQALAHPLRNRLLFTLGPEGATVSQLAARLRTNKGNVAHHLMVLERAGLARVGRTRTVRGGTERYWVRTVRRLIAAGGAAEYTPALMQAVAEEITEAEGEPMLNLRRVRLTRSQAKALADHLDRVVSELPEAPPGAPSHGVLVSVFERRHSG
jgi:DNA-binding transcriptional ArsR family regulator